MTRHYRFFVAPAVLTDAEPDAVLEVVDSDLKHQISKVLRLKDGDKITLLDGAGGLYQCLILPEGTAKRPSRELLSLKVLTKEHTEAVVEQTKLTVCLPLIKVARFEWALEKLTEVGVNCIIPTETTRTQAQQQKLSRWQSIIKEAAEQSEKLYLPELKNPTSLPSILESLKEHCTKSISDSERTLLVHLQEREKAPDMVQHLYNLAADKINPRPAQVVILLGPEGGFTDQEKQLINNCGATALSLGQSILRSETAAILAAGIAHLAGCVK